MFVFFCNYCGKKRKENGKKKKKGKNTKEEPLLLRTALRSIGTIYIVT